MNKYCVAIEIQNEHVEDYIKIHKNCWNELMQAMIDCGCENLVIHMYKNIAFIQYDCDDINDFYRKYGEKEITKKWNGIVLPWLKASPSLDGSDDVHTLEKVFDLQQQIN